MKSASKHIIDTLAERGYRITEARRELTSCLANSSQPLTIQDLAQATKSDEASAYRFIALLQKEALAEAIAVRGEKPRYALALHHHHHVVCTDCGLVAHVPCADEPTLPSTIGFDEIVGHEVTFYGRCATCVREV